MTEAQIAWAMAKRGLPLLTVPDAARGSEVGGDPSRLIEDLVRSKAPVHLATIPALLLLVPGVLAESGCALDALPAGDAVILRHLLAAAEGLQARWRSRLAALGPAVSGLDGHARALEMPDSSDLHGDVLLRWVWDRFESGEAGLVMRGMSDLVPRTFERALELVERFPVSARAG